MALTFKQPTLGNYNYNYILLKKSIELKVTAEFQNGEKFYSQSNGKSAEKDINHKYSSFKDNIVNFNFNDKAWDVDNNNNSVPGSSSYFKDTVNKVEGLLLDSDRNLSTINQKTHFILAVYDSTSSPIQITQNKTLNIVFTSTDKAKIISNDWSQIPTDRTKLTTNSIVKIINSGGNKYVFNNGNTYDSNLKYVLQNFILLKIFQKNIH